MSFNIFCIVIILPSFSQFVFANITSYFSLFLVCILWSLSFKGKRSFSFSFFIPDWANFKLRWFFLISKKSRFNILKASSYFFYFSFKNSFAKVFCVRSKSSLFSCVSELFHTAQDCSRTDRQNTVHKWTTSSI